MPTKLKKLLVPLTIKTEDIGNMSISGIQFRADLVTKGDLFVAINGFNHDGHNFINEAITNGAAVIVGEKNLTLNHVPYFQVSDARAALGKMASFFYHQPSSKHKMVGITGTNGKTTTAYMIRHLLKSANKTCSLFSTVANYLNELELISTATTPDALQLQKMLKVSRDEYAVMEVSSHGLDQKRVEGTVFDYALFTNLTYEHLDYHKNFQQYFASKLRLFKYLKPQGVAIVNSGCSWGKKIIKKLKAEGIPVFTYGNTSSDDLQFLTINGDTFVVNVFGEVQQFEIPMPGEYNVQNALAAILFALRSGLELQTIKQSLATFPGVQGRYELYPCPQGVRWIIDYAHTPDGLENFLRTVFKQKRKNLIHIFGFRGNKDTSKRQIMLQISARYCDAIILTLDDLNGVSEESMISDLKHLSKIVKGNIQIIADRTVAIKHAYEMADCDDEIVITGKGPEPYRQSFAFPATSDAEMINYLNQNSIKHLQVPASIIKPKNLNRII